LAEQQITKDEVDNKILKDNLPPLFKSYPGLNNAHPSSWLVWNAEGKNELMVKAPCHAHMHYQKGYDDLVTAVPASDTVSLEYLRMLIHGPFKGFSDLISLNKTDDYYLHLTNLNKWPANVIYNFCIASRVPIEKQNLLEYWYELVKVGFEPTLAFLLSYSTNGKKFDGHRSFVPLGHYWHDSSSNWSSIIKGDMVKMSKSFKTSPEATKPTNCIWGASSDHIKLRTMSDEQVSEFYKIPIQVPAKDPPKPIITKKKLAVAQALHQLLQDPALAGIAAAPPPPQPQIFQFDWGNPPEPADFAFAAAVPDQPPQPVIQQAHWEDEPDDPDFD